MTLAPLPSRESVIASVSAVVPDNHYDQTEIVDTFAPLMAERPAAIGTARRPASSSALFRRFAASSGVQTRHLALPISEYGTLDGFSAANDAFIEHGTALGAQAAQAALAKAGLTPADVDVLLFTTVTGVAAPSLDARMHASLGLRADVKRVPLFGLGCVAGAAGIARLHDYLAGHPDEVAVLVSVELCSLTVQRDDVSLANLVASSLFGDGAAAVVLVGENRAADIGRDGPAVRASRSRLYPGTRDVMGWNVGAHGFRIVLSADVGEVVRQYLGDDVKGFLADHDLSIPDIAAWVCHPGGPKVLDAVHGALGLEPGALDVTWRSLATVGNLSSASVLHVLHDTLRDVPPPPGTPGVLLAMGPGFCSELVLLRW